jgi:hypothetical protein
MLTFADEQSLSVVANSSIVTSTTNDARAIIYAHKQTNRQTNKETNKHHTHLG